MPREQCSERGRCAVFLAALAGNAVLVETVLREDLLTDRAPLIGVLRLKTNEYHMCAGCVRVLLERDREGRRRLWDRLPEMFWIEVEGWGYGERPRFPPGRSGDLISEHGIEENFTSAVLSSATEVPTPPRSPFAPMSKSSTPW